MYARAQWDNKRTGRFVSSDDVIVENCHNAGVQCVRCSVSIER